MLKRSFAILIALLLTLAIAAPSQAENPVNSDGFVATDGGLYLAPATGLLYTREDQWEWVAGYYSCNAYGCRTYTPGYWRFKGYLYKKVTVNEDAPDVETQLIKLAAARDAGVLKIAQAAQKSAAASALADKLGLAGNFAIPNYGAGVFPVPNYAGQLVTNAAIGSGATAYGYQTLTLEAKGADLNALLQMYGQAVQDQLRYGDAAHARLASTVDGLVERSERVRQTLASGAAISQAAQGVGKAVNPGTDIKTTVTTPVVVGPPAPVLNTQAAFLALTGPAQCVKCHSGDAPSKAKFDVSVYDPATADQATQDRVWNYLTSADKDHSCGVASGRTKMTPQTIAQFFTKK